MDKGWDPGRKGTGSRTGTEIPKVTGRVGKNYTTLRNISQSIKGKERERANNKGVGSHQD